MEVIMRKAYKTLARRNTIYSTIFTFFTVFYTAQYFIQDKSLWHIFLPIEILLTLLYTGIFFSCLLSELKFMDKYNLGLKISMAEDQENRRKMSFDFNDFDETINNKSTWNLLNTITTCLCFGIYAFSTIGNCAWWMIIILIIEAFILLLISGSVFSLYKDCKKKFKEIDKKFTEGVYNK